MDEPNTMFADAVIQMQQANLADEKGDLPLALVLYREAIVSLGQIPTYSPEDHASISELKNHFQARVQEIELELRPFLHHSAQTWLPQSRSPVPLLEPSAIPSSYAQAHSSSTHPEYLDTQHKYPFSAPIGHQNHVYAPSAPPISTEFPANYSTHHASSEGNNPFITPHSPPRSPVPPEYYPDVPSAPIFSPSQDQSHYPSLSRPFVAQVPSTNPLLPSSPPPQIQGEALHQSLHRSPSLPSPTVPSSPPASPLSRSSPSVRLPSPSPSLYHPPTWQADDSTSSCSVCGESFTVLYRRHHCRACGRVVCGVCSPNTLALPSLGFKEAVRVCTPCYKALIGGDTWFSQQSSLTGLSKLGAELTRGLSSTMKATVRSAGAGYETFMSAVRIQVKLNDAHVEALASRTRFSTQEIKMLARTYSALIDAISNSPSQDARKGVGAALFCHSLGLLGYVDSFKPRQNSRLPLISNWLWAAAPKSSPNEMNFESYVQLHDILLHPIGVQSLAWAFDRLPLFLQPSSTSSSFVSADLLHSVMESAIYMLQGMGLSEFTIVRLREAVSSVITRYSSWGGGGISKEDYIGGPFCVELVSSLSGVLPTGEPRYLTSFGDGSKKRGTVLPLGHVNFPLQITLALGFSRTMERDLESPPAIFSETQIPDKDIAWQFELPLVPRSLGLASLPEHFVSSHFTTYAPDYFALIRSYYNISNEEYRASLGIESMLIKLLFCGHLASFQQIGSHGKSGSIFFYSSDARFLVKTISEGEFRTLKDMVDRYVHHLTAGPSLLVPILGLHRLIPDSATPNNEMFIIVMLNLFSEKAPALLYDLKGSEVGRTTPESERKPGVPLKDLDLNRSIYLDRAANDRLWTALRRDALFLCRQGTMDYSLLVGFDEPQTLLPLDAPGPSAEKLFWFRSGNGDEVLRLGIIDYLVSWDITKKIESAWKGISQEKDKISAVPPEAYSKRFLTYFEKVFPQ